MSNTEQTESTVNEYLTRVRDDSRLGVVRPLFEENIKFELWGQCIDELKDNVFLGNNDENPLEHISNITSIVNLFQSPRVSRDHVMLMAFPFTLKGKAKVWINRLSAGSITTWDLLKNAFLSRYHPLSQIIRQTKAIRNFGLECNKPLHLAWERFNDLLYNCLEHKINEHEQLQIFYQGLDPKTRKKADFMGLIPRMTPVVGIKAIDEFVLNEEVRMVQHQYKTPNDERDSLLEELLEETVSSFIKEAHWRQKKSENPPIPFPRRLKKEKEKEQFQKFIGNLQQLHINIPFIEALEQMPKYAKFMKDLLSKRGKGSEASKIILNEQCTVIVLNKVPPKEKDPRCFTIPCVIGQSGITKALADWGLA
ncbi:integrase, catalytic region, zinc finger, CCHC-type containing protein [Tanacetum coccineum]